MSAHSRPLHPAQTLFFTLVAWLLSLATGVALCLLHAYAFGNLHQLNQVLSR